jgi:hypothetical protein
VDVWVPVVAWQATRQPENGSGHALKLRRVDHEVTPDYLPSPILSVPILLDSIVLEPILSEDILSDPILSEDILSELIFLLSIFPPLPESDELHPEMPNPTKATRAAQSKASTKRGIILSVLDLLGSKVRHNDGRRLMAGILKKVVQFPRTSVA